MGDSVVGLARSFLSSCTGYFWSPPPWRTEAERRKALAEKSRTQAIQCAEDAEDLLDQRALKLGAGVTALRGATARAGVAAKTARQAVVTAEAEQKAVAKLLRDNNQAPDAVGDLPGIVRATQDGERRATAGWQSLRDAGGPSDSWHILAERLNGGVLVRIKALAATPNPGPTEPLLQAHKLLCDQLNAGAVPPFEQSKVEGAVQKVTVGLGKLEKAVVGVEGRGGGGGKGLDTLRGMAFRQFEVTSEGYGLSGVIDDLLATLQETNPKFKKQHLAPLTQRQDSAPDRLQVALKKADSPEAIENALNEALRAYREAVASLATNIANGTDLPRALEKAKAGLATDEDAALYETKRVEVEQALMDLRIAGASTYGESRKRLDGIVEATGKTGDYKAAATKTLPALLTEIDKQYETHKKQTEPQVDALRNEAARLRGELAKAAKLPNAKQAAGLLATIGANLDEADNFIDCNGNIEAAEPAQGILDEVKTLLADFQSASGVFATLAKTLGEIKTGLGHADLTLIPATDLAALTQRLAELQSPGNGLSAAEFKTAVEVLKTTLTTQTQFGGALKAWRITATKELGDLTTAFDAYAKEIAKTPANRFAGTKPEPAKGEIKATLDGMAALLAASVASADFDSHKTQWTQALQSATAGLAIVWDAGAKTLKDLAAASTDSAAGQQRAEEVTAVTRAWTALDGKAKSYEKLIAAANGNAGDYKLLLRQLAAMPAQIASNPEAARAQLADIEKRLDSIRGTPDFDQAIARAIAKVPSEWTAVAAHTGKQLDALVQAVAGAAQTTEFEGSLGELRGLVSEVKSRFPADAFKTAAEALAQPDPTGAERGKRRAHREDGIRLVRQLQSQLFDDPLFSHLQANPFGIPVFGPLFRFLDRVELEFLRIAI